MASILHWMKRIGSDPEAGGVIMLGTSVQAQISRRGKSPFAGLIENAVAESGAEPGDIVEVDQHGAARIVGRRPRLAGEPADMSANAIRARLRTIYGDYAASLADVTAGTNVVVFRTPNRA